MYRCNLCNNETKKPEKKRIRSNIRRFRKHNFEIWRCKTCQSLHCEEVENLDSYYEHYPLRKQESNYFTNQWFANILKRLKKVGLKKHHQILDYGCNEGNFIKFLQCKGYKNVEGYDLYVEGFSDKAVLEKKYDFIINLDVIEHVQAPSKLFSEFAKLLNPDGVLCVETPNAAGIDLDKKEDYIHALHAPFHIHILSPQALKNLAEPIGFSAIKVYNRWYMDSWKPFTSRRFIETFMSKQGNDMDSAFEPAKFSTLVSLSIWLYGLFGYFMPNKKNDHVMMMFRRGPIKPVET